MSLPFIAYVVGGKAGEDDNVDMPAIIVAKPLKRPRIDVYYPELYGLEDKEVEKKLNERIFRQVDTMIRKQLNDVPFETEITGVFDIKNNQRNIVSVTNSHYSYSGGAHGITIQRSLTMNISNGDIYSLKDLFQPNAPYVDRLNEIIVQQIHDRKLDLLGDYPGIHPNQYFYIADKALVIYFQLYELQAYVYGFPYFVISVFDIQDIIKEDGPLGVMIY